MAKRDRKPDEALGPAVDGLEHFVFPVQIAREEPRLPQPEETAIEPEPAEESILLLCGSSPLAEAVGRLGRDCGFSVEVAVADADMGKNGNSDLGENHHLEDFTDIVEECGIGRAHYVCIFLENEDECESILRQCLASEASYIGLKAAGDMKESIYRALREHGAPDAELAAVCCPMGLNIGASDDMQEAVGIVAEVMAARAGTLKRLRHEYKPARGRARSIF